MHTDPEQASEPTRPDRAPEAVEYLYGTHTGEDLDGFIRTRLTSFRITKKTAKRIYYVRRVEHDGNEVIGFVDRQAMEASGADGLWARKTAGWWEDDNRLYLNPPPLPGQQPTIADLQAEVDRLRREAADAHPDRGGNDIDFIAAHRRLTEARSRLFAQQAERAA